MSRSRFTAISSPVSGVLRLVHARWLLLALATLTILLAAPVFGITLSPLLWLLVGSIGVLNLLLTRWLRRMREVSARVIVTQLLVDLLFLGAMFYLSGGAANPFVSLMLLTVAVGAMLLPWPHAMAIGGLAVAIYSALWVWSIPLQMEEEGRAVWLHLLGMWMTFVFSACLLVWLITRLTSTLRARDQALASAREQALVAERVTALGTLAAGAAHELGTPLGTIAIVVEELAADSRLPNDVNGDVKLLRQQVATCKAILSRLVDQAGVPRQEEARAVASRAWLAALEARWRSMRVRTDCILRIEAEEEMRLIADPMLEQAILNLFDNAAEAGSGKLSVRLVKDGDNLVIEVADEGTGFPEVVLTHGGKRRLNSTKGGAGIGLVVTRAMLARLGGTLILANHSRGGVARIELPLSKVAPTMVNDDE